MKKVSEYLEHARECRLLADGAASLTHREILLGMAKTWETLADDRKEWIARDGRAKTLDGALHRIPKISGEAA